MNDIEFDIQNRETRAWRGKQARRQRRWKQGMVTLTGLTACSLTLLVGSNLIQSTYSIFTSKAALSGGFTAKDSFCGRDDERDDDDHDDRHRDLTVSDALYTDPGTPAQDKKGGGKGDDKGSCQDGREHDDNRDHDDDKHMTPDATLPSRPEDAPEPPAPTDQPAMPEPQVSDDLRIPPQRIEHPMSSPSDVPPR